MANNYRLDERISKHPLIHTNQTLQESHRNRNYESDSEPTFSPTGLLGERYDTLKQQMEVREGQQSAESPFTRGLVGSLAQFENAQQMRNDRASHDGSRFGGGLSRAPSTTTAASYRSFRNSQDFGRPRRTSSVTSKRTDSIYCAQTGVTPPPLLDMSSTAPQRPSWREQTQVRSASGQPLVTLPENSSQSTSSPATSLSRSHSVAVRPSSGTWASSNRSWQMQAESPTVSRRGSSATVPARSETWYEGDRAEPKRRGTLRSC